MRKNKKITLFMLTILMMYMFIVNNTFAERETKNILYINSYHIGYEWSDDIYGGLKLSIKEYDFNTRLTVEHMDSERFSDVKSKELFIENMKHKYTENSFDVIVVSDDAAFSYIQNEGKEIFADIPVVFCGVNNLKAVNMDKHENYTGIVEISDFAKTIEVALILKPEVENIYYVNDETLTGKYLIEEFLGANDSGQYNILELEGETLDEVFENISSLGEDSIVVFVGFYKKNGVFYDFDDIYARIKKVDNVAIFGNQEFYLSDGLVGGYISNGFDHGHTAGDMAYEILNGKSPKDISILGENFNELWFNYEELDEQGINISDVPRNSIFSGYKMNGIKNIGILHSYESESFSSAEFDRGVNSYLTEKNYKFKLIREYLDVEKISDQNYLNTFYDYLEYKYDKIGLDAVVSYRAPAYEFVKKYNFVREDGHFVYAYSEDEDIRLDSTVLSNGIIGVENITANINLAMELNPILENIIVITDNTNVGTKYKDAVQKYEKEYKEVLNFQYWNDYNIEEISEKASWLSSDSAMLFMNFSRDNQNRVFLQNESFTIISDKSTAPIYTINEEFIGEGALGGRVVSAYKTGRLVGEHLDLVFSGGRFDEKENDLVDTTAYIFDYDMLMKFGINQDILPKGSTIINEPKTLKIFVEENSLATKLIAIIFIAMLITISIMFAYVKYKHKVQRKMHFFATRDEMTNTYNRRHAYEFMEDLIEDANEKFSKFSICFIDINGLKKVNDKFGHIVGDKLIVEVCNIVQNNIRGDDYLSRFGGDEFLIVMPSTNLNEAKNVLDRIQREVKSVNELNEDGFEIAFSKGFAEYSFEQPTGVENLIHKADVDMYNEKERSKVSVPRAPKDTSDKVIYLEMDKKK